LAANTGQTFTSTATATRVRRKDIVFTNFDASAYLQLRVGSTVCGAVWPQTSIILPITTPITLHNQNPSSVACAVMEIYYVS
jgi:hypothetical protein